MQTIYWEVHSLSNTTVRRHCKRCGTQRDFAPTGRFRINANKRKLDVWLMYRCTQCGNGWNLPLYERVPPQSLPKAERLALQQNDAATAQKYATNAALLAKHGCAVAPPAWEVVGETPPFGRTVRLVLHSKIPLPIRAAKLVRQKLGLSAKAFATLAKTGRIRCEGGGDAAKQKLGLSAVFLLTLKAPPGACPVRFRAPPQLQTQNPAFWGGAKAALHRCGAQCAQVHKAHGRALPTRKSGGAKHPRC